MSDTSAPLPAPATDHATRALNIVMRLDIAHGWEIVSEQHNMLDDEIAVTLEAPDRSASVIVRYRTKDSDR